MSAVQLLAAVVGILVTLLGQSSGFLGTKLDANDPELSHILCPEETTGKTRDHKWITREAIRRNIRQFFLDYPPPDQPEFSIPEAASLTEIYHAYYGEEVSAARFIRAVNTIAEANVHADTSDSLRYNPTIHADGEVFDDFHYGMSDRYPQIITSITVEEAYPAARSFLGITLHSLQKFYAHSTWIEQGNTEILKELGLPGYTGFADPAEPSEAVCTPCSSSQGECRDNVIMGAGITTGYYTYEGDLAAYYLIPKPESGVKCSHGGVLDTSSEDPAIGGINKDTASPCFSPHYYLHAQAAELAIQATDYYLSVVLEAVEEDKYRELFDLYQGSALSIVIDTTSSMGSEISAVKNQVHEIVETAFAGTYILVPYNDPDVGPAIKTKDADEFLAAVDALHATGGGDLPEMFWGGLQIALTLTPEYGNIFCFTDAKGKDGEKMEGNIALAQQKQTKISVIYSGHVTQEDSNNIKTSVEDYMNLCEITGGLFIPADKFEMADITPLLDDTLGSTEVDIAIVRDIEAVKDIEFPIDDSIIDFKVQVAGDPAIYILRDPEGKEYDLLDQSAMEDDPNIDVIAYTGHIRAIRLHNAILGSWTLKVMANTGTLSASVQGNSALSWIGGLSVLVTDPPHPHYMNVEGRPLIDTVYYIDVNLIGYIEKDVATVDYINFVDTQGNVLRTIDYNDEIDDEFYIRSEPLPTEYFYMYMYGTLSSGNVFCRLMSVLMMPVLNKIDVESTLKELSAKPGESAHGTFLLTNFGSDSDFLITGTDDKGYMTNITASVNVLQDSSGFIFAEFTVPANATPGTVSAVTVTAASVIQPESVNSAVTQFIVLPVEVDHDKPTCVIDQEASCDGFTSVGSCMQKNWTTSAILTDIGAGMNTVYAKPEGFAVEVEPFVPGYTDAIGITYTASCCVLEANIIGVDMVGNVGECVIDMGAQGGSILDFEAIEVGETWVYLRWSLSPTEYELHKYSLIVNNDYMYQFPCKDETCYYNATDLDPCQHQDFDLTPIFSIEGEDQEGEPAYTDATTLSINPGVPINGLVESTSETQAKISWTAVDTICVSEFEVCVKPLGYADPSWCDSTQDHSYIVKNLEACTVYTVEVSSLGMAGHRSTDSLEIEVITQEGALGEPVNFQVNMTGDNSAILTWYDPDDHASCIETYAVTTNMEDGSNSKVSNIKNSEPKKHVVVEENLIACSNYTFKVFAISLAGNLGPYALQKKGTPEIDPSPIDALDLVDIGATSINASWTSENECTDHYRVCYYSEYDLNEICEDVDSSQLSLSDLLECSIYHVSVTPVTPSGMVGQKKAETANTLDVAPSEPRNLKVNQTTAHTIQVEYEEPESSPQCATHYGLDISKKSQMIFDRTPVSESHFKHHLFEDLDACTDYVITVNARTDGGLSSTTVETQATTDIDDTSAARNFGVDSKTQTTINLRWFAPETNGACVNIYTLTWGEGSLTVGPPAPGEHLPLEDEVTIDGLTACTEYTFELTPFNANDIAGPTTTLTVTTAC